MVKRNQFVLYVGARPHLLRGAEQHPYLPGANLSKQLLLLCVCVGVMDKGYFFSRYTPGNQLLPQVVIHILE